MDNPCVSALAIPAYLPPRPPWVVILIATSNIKPTILMARFITLLNYTDQGAKSLKDSTSRARSFDELAEKSGVRVDGQYWTLGCCDGVLILSADSETRVLRLLTQLAAQGNVRTETLPAFNGAEFDAIVK